MAKRHKSLILLSQDHHHGLALALRLRQGNKALLNDGWTHDRDAQARVVQVFYDTELRAHFRAEEEVVFPLLAKYVPESSTSISILLQQHREIERLVDTISHSIKTQRENLLVALGVLLEKHIRLEERDLFEMFQSRLSPDVLERVGDEVNRIHAHKS